MADWPLLDGQGCETAGVTSASSTGVAVTSSASTNTKGAWVELLAASSRPAVGMIVGIRRGHTALMSSLIDIGIGAAASETVIVPNLIGDCGTNLLTRSGPILIPIAVPAGSRIAARAQATVASANPRVQVTLLYGSWHGQALSRVTDYGTNTADSGGVSVDPGAVANTKGAWSQITASTTHPMRALIIGVGNMANSGRSVNTDWLLDIGMGGSGSETVIVADQQIECSTTDDLVSPTFIGPIPCNIPAGTRLAARSQASNVGDDNDRLFDVIIYGLD